MAGAGGAAGIRSVGTTGGLIRFTFQLDTDRIDVVLERFGNRVQDFTTFWTDYLAPKFYADVQSNFEREGGAVGGWPALSARYAAWKASHYPGKKILQRQGKLLASLSGIRKPFGIFVPGKQTLLIGTRRTPWHQTGGSHLPKRRFLFLPYNASQTYGRLLHQFAVRTAKASGLPTTAG